MPAKGPQDEHELFKHRNMAQPLPWPRGQVPKFGGQKAPDYAKPHWKIGVGARCAQCKSVMPCIHKMGHQKKMAGAFVDPHDPIKHPDFMVESKVWREQLMEARKDNGDRRLANGTRLPAGKRHGWGSYAGYEAPMGTTRDMGEYRLVFVPYEKNKGGGGGGGGGGSGGGDGGGEEGSAEGGVMDGGGVAAVSSPGGGAERGGAARGAGVSFSGKTDVLEYARQAEEYAKSPTPTIIASETGRGMYRAKKEMRIGRAWANASTPELVKAINDLKRGGGGGAPETPGRIENLAENRSHSVPLSTRRCGNDGGARSLLPYAASPGGHGGADEWVEGGMSAERVRRLQELKEGPEARLLYRGGKLVLASSMKNTPTKTELIDSMSPVVTKRNPSEAIELHFKKMAIKKAQVEREIKEGKRRRRRKAH